MDIKLSCNINNKKKTVKIKRKENVISFVSTERTESLKIIIGRIFIKLISKHFPPNYKFIKIFNKNAAKLNYTYMPNTRSKINDHNKKLSPQNHKNHAIALLDKIVQKNGLFLTSHIFY